jgi:hypothetical protein
MGTRAITPLPLRAGRVDSLPARGNSVKKRTRDMVLGMKRGSTKILWVHYNHHICSVDYSLVLLLASDLRVTSDWWRQGSV